MNVLVIGAKGQLGRELCRVFSKEARVTGADLPELDVADAESVAALVMRHAPALVINAAGYTDVEGAEDDPDGAFAVNETGVHNVAAAAAEAGAPVVYYSTDFVFFGAQDDLIEPDESPMPRGVYSRSKATGESATCTANPKHFVVRTAWLYGPGGNNFVEKILRAAETQPELKVVQDEVGSPTYTLDVAEATRALCQTGAYGVYHAVNRGQCSRYEFACEILRLAGVTTPVTPCTMAEYPMKAPRPHFSVLSNAKLEETCGHIMRPWQEALAQYMQRRIQHT